MGSPADQQRRSNSPMSQIGTGKLDNTNNYMENTSQSASPFQQQSQPRQSTSPLNSNMPYQQQQQPNQLKSRGNAPDNLELEQKRVSLILEINVELLRYAMALKDEQSRNSISQSGPGGSDSSTYMACMKRIQCNLTYLASLADKSKSLAISTPPFPQILAAPRICLV